MVIGISEYWRLRGQEPDFKGFLRAAPDFDVLRIDRASAPARVVDMGEGE